MNEQHEPRPRIEDESFLKSAIIVIAPMHRQLCECIIKTTGEQQFNGKLLDLVSEAAKGNIDKVTEETKRLGCLNKFQRLFFDVRSLHQDRVLSWISRQGFEALTGESVYAIVGDEIVSGTLVHIMSSGVAEIKTKGDGIVYYASIEQVWKADDFGKRVAEHVQDKLSDYPDIRPVLGIVRKLSEAQPEPEQEAKPARVNKRPSPDEMYAQTDFINSVLDKSVYKNGFNLTGSPSTGNPASVSALAGILINCKFNVASCIQALVKSGLTLSAHAAMEVVTRVEQEAESQYLHNLREWVKQQDFATYLPGLRLRVEENGIPMEGTVLRSSDRLGIITLHLTDGKEVNVLKENVRTVLPSTTTIPAPKRPKLPKNKMLATLNEIVYNRVEEELNKRMVVVEERIRAEYEKKYAEIESRVIGKIASMFKAPPLPVTPASEAIQAGDSIRTKIAKIAKAQEEVNSDVPKPSPFSENFRIRLANMRGNPPCRGDGNGPAAQAQLKEIKA